MFASTKEKLKKELIDKGFLTEDQKLVIEEECLLRNYSFEESCVKLGFVTLEIVQDILFQITGFKYIDLENFSIDKDLFLAFDLETQKKCSSIIFDKDNKTIKIAMVDPENLAFKDILNQMVFEAFDIQTRLQIFRANKEQMNAFWEKKLFLINHKQYNKDFSVRDTSQFDAADNIEAILKDAIVQEASDIHFQPEELSIKILYRIDGVLQTIRHIHKNQWEKLLISFKVKSNLDIAEIRRPQSGSFRENFAGKNFDFRISTHPTIFGESLVIRILYKNKEIISLEQIGFDIETSNILLEKIKLSNGMILICGPTGSGKTTTIYSLCSNLDSSSRNIMTLEEPVEYKLKNIRQTEIQQNGVVSFADGVRSILRQDPDVIFIGEIRDEDTAKIALRAAMTGHLVLSTLHANDVFRVLGRLFDLGVKASLLSGQLLIIVSQRLVRKFCTQCLGKGCNNCNNTGFKGRTAISEILQIDEEVDRLISEEKSALEIMRYVKKSSNNFQTIWDDGLKKVKNNITSELEIKRVLGAKY